MSFSPSATSGAETATWMSVRVNRNSNSDACHQTQIDILCDCEGTSGAQKRVFFREEKAAKEARRFPPFSRASYTASSLSLAAYSLFFDPPTHPPKTLTRDCPCQSCDRQEPCPPTNPSGEFPSHPIAHSLSDHGLFRVVLPLHGFCPTLEQLIYIHLNCIPFRSDVRSTNKDTILVSDSLRGCACQKFAPANMRCSCDLVSKMRREPELGK
jgi:hypothetical protein